MSACGSGRVRGSGFDVAKGCKGTEGLAAFRVPLGRSQHLLRYIGPEGCSTATRAAEGPSLRYLLSRMVGTK